MRNFKFFDLVLQATLIVGGFLYIFVAKNSFIKVYFAVGGWQLFSCLVHASFNSKFLSAAGRKSYLQTLFWLFILCILSVPVWILYGFALLVVSPFMATWYWSICYSEYRMLQARALIHLK